HHHRISIFDTSGAFLAKWGVFGSGAGELNGPAGVAIDADDHVYVVDQNNHRVQKFTTDGTYILQWGEAGTRDGQVNLPWGVAVRGAGGKKRSGGAGGWGGGAGTFGGGGGPAGAPASSIPPGGWGWTPRVMCMLPIGATPASRNSPPMGSAWPALARLARVR